MSVQVTFVNRLAVIVRVDWSNGDGSPADSAEIKPNSQHTFHHGRGSNIDYGIFAVSGTEWVKFDQDYVTLLLDRNGEIKTMQQGSVEWN